MQIKLIGAPINLGYANPHVAVFPQLIRQHGLLDMFEACNFSYQDFDDLPIPKSRKANHTTSSAKHLSAVTTFSQNLAATVSSSITSATDIPIILGGDHSLGIGSVSGVAQKRHIGVLWVDAHPDAHTPDTTHTGWIYGMPTAAISGLGLPQLTTIGGPAPRINPTNLCIFGARYYEPEEITHINQLGATLITMDDIMERGLSNCLHQAIQVVTAGTTSIHVSFDLDSIDQLYAPGVTEPSQGMFTYREINYIMTKLGQTGQVGSLDVCEYDYTKDVDNQTLHLAIELIAKLLGQNYSVEYNTYLQQNNVR